MWALGQSIWSINSATSATSRLQSQLSVRGRDWRIAVAAQIHPHHPVMLAERRDPGKVAPSTPHRRVQQQQDGRFLPGVGEVVDIVGELRPVACLEGVHCNLSDFVTVLAAVTAIIYDLAKRSNPCTAETS